MATNTISYTGRDVADIRRELIDMIPPLTTKWTDFNESDLGITLIELIASAQDMQNFYFDTQAFETYLDTAVQYKNIRSLARAMNYRIPLKSSSAGDIVITFEDSSYKEVDIPKYTLVKSSFSEVTQTYFVSENTYKSGEFDTMTVPVMEGTVSSIEVQKTQLANTLTSAGIPSRRIYLGSTDVADGTVRVLQEGAVWEECDDALLKYEGGYYYSVHVDSNGQVYVLMSVNYLDLIPDEGSLEVKFIITNGVNGQVKAGVLNQIDINRSDIVSVNNTFGTYGASNEADLFRLKVLAREHAITMDRYITLEDYKNAVDSEPYVFRSVVKDWKYPEFVDSPYLVKVWVVDSLGQSLRGEYASRLRQKLLEKGNVEVDVEIQNTETISFDIEANVILLARRSEDRESIRQTIIDYLRRTYSTERQDFGSRISYSVMTSRILSISQYIKDVLVLTPSMDIECSAIQFPVLNNITINIVDNF